MSGRALPPGWVVRSLFDSGRWVGGSTPSKRNPSYWSNGTIPWVSPKDMKQFLLEGAEDLITEDAVSESNTSLVPARSVLVVARSGILQRTLPVSVNAVDVTINQDMKALTPDGATTATFIARCLIARESELLEACRKAGTTVASLDTEAFFAQEVPVPPLNEQKRIVARLEAVQARAEAARQALDRVGELLEQFRQSVLAAAFRGDLTREWRARNPNAEPASALLTRIRAERRRRWEAANPKKKYVEPEPVDPTGLPELPEGWCWAWLTDCGEVARGKSKHRPRNDERLFGTEYPFIQTGEVARSGGRIGSATRFYSEFGLAQSRLFPVGTVCITIAANIADSAVLDIDACFPDSVVGVTPDLGLLPPDLIELFIRTIRNDLNAFAPATAQKNINLEVLSGVAVPVPPQAEQYALQASISRAMSSSDCLRAAAVESVDQLNRLTQATLQKAFRGELVPQDPTDEPAEALLARIAAERATSVPKGRGRRAKG